MTEKLTKVEAFDVFMRSGIALYPDRLRPFNPATCETSWTLAVECEDDRARDLTRIPMSTLRIAVLKDGAPQMTNGELLDTVANEWPEFIRIDGAVLPCVLGEGSCERQMFLSAMRKGSISRVGVSTIMERPDKPGEEYLLCLRWKGGGRPGIRRAHSLIQGPADFRHGILLVAP